MEVMERKQETNHQIIASTSSASVLFLGKFTRIFYFPVCVPRRVRLAHRLRKAEQYLLVPGASKTCEVKLDWIPRELLHWNY